VIVNWELPMDVISCGVNPMELTMRVLPGGIFILKLPSGAALAPVLEPFTLSVAPEMGVPVESTIFPVTSCVCALAIEATKRHAKVIDKNFLILLIGLTAVEVRRQFLAGGSGLPNEDVGYPKGRFFEFGGRLGWSEWGKFLEIGVRFFGVGGFFLGFVDFFMGVAGGGCGRV